MLYHSAMIQAKSGDVNSAKRALVTLLDSDAEFPEREEAVALLRRL